MPPTGAPPAGPGRQGTPLHWTPPRGVGPHWQAALGLSPPHRDSDSLPCQAKDHSAHCSPHWDLGQDTHSSTCHHSSAAHTGHLTSTHLAPSLLLQGSACPPPNRRPLFQALCFIPLASCCSFYLGLPASCNPASCLLPPVFCPLPLPLPLCPCCKEGTSLLSISPTCSLSCKTVWKPLLAQCSPQCFLQPAIPSCFLCSSQASQAPAMVSSNLDLLALPPFPLV